MDAAFSFLISAGIIAFGIWIVAGTIAAGSPLAWTLMGLLTVIVGSISLIKQLAMSKSRSCPGPRTLNMGDAADGFAGIKAHRR